MRLTLLVFLVGPAVLSRPAAAAEPSPLFAAKNLTAWCIVPFDAKKRTPEQRLDMLKRLGFTRYAYDWRDEHLACDTAREFKLIKDSGLTLQAVWFPAAVGKPGEQLLQLLREQQLKTELWVMLPQPDPKFTQAEQVAITAKLVTSLAQLAAKDGHTIGLYNHGGWTGEPANLMAVRKACGEQNVGIVYNLHHGHQHLDHLAEHLREMKPALLSVNLNGMERAGEKTGNKILCIGDGEDDATVLKTISESGYAGPIGIIGHTEDDVELRLQDNLHGLRTVLRNDGSKAGYATRTVRSVNIALEQNQFVVRTTKPNAEAMRVVVSDVASTSKAAANRPAVLGTSTIEGNTLRFTPRFPPVAGKTYRVTYAQSTRDITKPKPERKAAVGVRTITPCAGTLLPENALRFYLHFHTPMKRGDAYRELKLTNEDGTEVRGAFLQTGDELWSKDGLRLTVMLDPGRVKHELVPRAEEGPVLEAGKRYSFVVSKEWEDEDGDTMLQDFSAGYRVTEACNRELSPANWKIKLPDTNGTLDIGFDCVIDSELSQRLIGIEDDKGQRVEAWTGVKFEAKTLSFGHNIKLWPAGNYTLVIDSKLEDICGNRIGSAFETAGADIKPLDETPLRIPFVVTAKK